MGSHCLQACACICTRLKHSMETFKLGHVSCKTGPGYIFSGVQCELASVATSTKEMLFDACRIYMQRVAKQSGHELVNGCRCM